MLYKYRHRYSMFIAFIILCLYIANSVSASPTEEPQTVTPVPTPSEQAFDAQALLDDITARKKQLDSEIETAKSSLTVPDATDELSLQLKAYIDLLNQIDGIMIQEQSTIPKITNKIDQNKQLESDISKLKNQVPPEKVSYLEVDQLKDELTAANKKTSSIDLRIKTAQDALVQAQKTWDDKEATRRQAKDLADKNTDQNQAQLLLFKLRTARTDSRCATEALRLRGLELRNERLAQTSNELQIEYLTSKIELLKPVAVFSQDDLQEQLQIIDKEKDDINQLLKKASGAKDLAEKRLNVARTNLAQKTDPDRALIEEVKARERELEVAQTQIDICALRLDRLSNRTKAWQWRYDVINNIADIDTEKTWETETQDYLKKLDIDTQTVRSRLLDRHNDLTSLQSAIESIQDPANPALRWLKEQQKNVQTTFNLWQENMSKIELTRQLYTKLLNELQKDTATLSLMDWITQGYNWVHATWNTEIYVYKDNEIEKSYYVKTIFYVLFFFIAGFILSRWISRFIGKFMINRIKIHEGAANTIESLIFYLLLICIFFYTLRFLNIPLTLFTVFGGAFAIAVGFGSQNIFNNFISGLILLAERPIRVGDIIEVDGILGRVYRLGARCTQIHTFTSLDVIVPNSAFLERKFTNWTLSNRILRTDIKIGVAYDSPTRKVQQILESIIESKDGILKDPPPNVFFMNFGDNSLDFEIRYFVNIGKNDKMRLDSDIHHEIVEELRKENITIAFPQRDIHLDTQSPLSIRVLPDQPQSGNPPESQ